MNFVDFINDQKRRLKSRKYVDMLWGMITECPDIDCPTVEEEEIYKKHIPIEFTKFLKRCVEKLRDIKLSDGDADWGDVDESYFCTLLYYGLQYEDVTKENTLYATSAFFLINVLSDSRRFFHKTLYIKIMEVLQELNRSQDISISGGIINVMDDFKSFLKECSIDADLIIPTVSVLHDYSYCCNDVFETIDLNTSFSNMGYIAFVGLKALTEQFARHKNRDKKLFPILLAFISNLKSSINLNRTVRLTHQSNFRLFIKENIDHFSSRSFCLVSDVLKYAYLHAEYDDYDGIATIIQELPSEKHKSFLEFFKGTLMCNKTEFKKNSLNMVLPILSRPPPREAACLSRAETLMKSVIKLCGDSDHWVQYKCLSILFEYSNSEPGCSLLKRILSKDDDTINTNLFMSQIHKMVDHNWNKKEVNVNYIRLICNLMCTQRELINLQTLNNLRNICLAGSPYDVKPCSKQLKYLFECRVDEPIIIIYILSIYVKQLLHPMQTSAYFAKELHEFIFSHVTLEKEHSFIWSIINYLISNNFNAIDVFDKFHSLALLKADSVKVLMEHKIKEDDTRTPALKLLCILSYFIKFKSIHYLEEKLEHTLTSCRITLSDTDMYLLMYTLNKQLKMKKRAECSSTDLYNYRQLFLKIRDAFYDQLFPINCVKCVILLLTSYGELLLDESFLFETGAVQFEENLSEKLTGILANKLEHSSYISRDVAYLAELITLKGISLTSNTVSKLKAIASIQDYTSNFLSYLKGHRDVWLLCVYLYMKVCFANEDMIVECVKNLDLLMQVANDDMKLQIIYGLLDMCNMHLQYYDPLLPHLLTALYNKNSYLRFIASKILMRLIGDERLRLVDGQYFLFMGLLADEKEIISKNVEIFVREKYAKKYVQTIAGYFVPSIIHYNLYYEHPAITLSQSDQDLLKKRIYSWNDRSFIYYFLYEPLSDKLKFSILNQISSEIIDRIRKKAIPHSAETFRILEDALAVILYTVPKDKIVKIDDDREFYETELKHINRDLLVADLRQDETTLALEHLPILKNLLTSLIELLFSDISQNPNICQNLFFTIIVFTKTFYSSIKRIINEESGALKSLYNKLSGFYVEMKQNFVYCLLTVNSCYLETLKEKGNLEFYLHELPNFHLISPSLILGTDD